MALLASLSLVLALTHPGAVPELRDELRAVGRAASVRHWYAATQGLAPELPAFAHDAEYERRALEALQRATPRDAADALALRFLRRTLEAERVALAAAPWDVSVAEATAVELPGTSRSATLRDLPTLIAQEPDARRRAELSGAFSQALDARVNPLLAARVAAVQAAARELGYADSVAFAEELREVDLHALLAQGATYVRATDAVYLALLDRVARDELGIDRAQLRQSDLPRLWLAPGLARFFDARTNRSALDAFLGGLGLPFGAGVQVDDAPTTGKPQRAFTEPVDPPRDVRVSVKPQGGLADAWTLFHEAGHAVHFSAAGLEPFELRTLGHRAPGEAVGELFRFAFGDPAWLSRFRDLRGAQGNAAPADAELARVARLTALVELYSLRRSAFAAIAFELRLHGRPPAELREAAALFDAPLPDDLRALYATLFARASGVAVTNEDAAGFRSADDDTFSAADYARAFVLAGQLQDALRSRFGAGFYGDARVGAYLRANLLEAGTSLTADEAARRFGLDGVDFGAAAARALRLVTEADALEKAR